MVKEMVKWSRIHIPDRNNAKTLSFLEGHPLPMPTMFGQHPLSRSWVILLTDKTNDSITDRMTETQNEQSRYSASLGAVTIVISVLL